MAEREELILEVEVDADRATSDLRGVEREADNVEEAFEDVGTAAERAGRALVEAAESARTEMVQAKAATDALANALGPELAGKADLDSVVADLQRMGLSLEEIRAEADTLATAMKQVDGVRLQGLSQGVDITRSSMSGLRDSADQSRSVLANLAGNASQDLGELGGVAGTAGVAIGQLAEYAVDGNIKLRNLAGVAAPMLGVALATKAISTALEGVRAEDAFRAELVEKFGDALRDAQDAATTLRDIVLETGRLDFSDEGGFLGLGQESEDLLPVLNRMGLSFQDFNQLVQLSVEGGTEALDAFFSQLNTGMAQFGNANVDADALADGIDQYADAIRSANEGQRIFNETVGVDALEQLNEQFRELQDPMETLPDLWDALITDARDGTFNFENAADAITQLAQATGESEEAIVSRINQEADKAIEAEAEAAAEAAEAQREHAAAVRESIQALDDYLAGFDPAASRLAGFTEALATLNSASELTSSQEVIEFADALNEVGSAVKDLVDSDVDLEGLDLVPDSWAEVQNMPEELRPVIDALGQFRGTMQSEFTEAFEQGGSTEAREWAADTRAAIVKELREAGIEAPEQVNQIISALGLLPDQVETTIRISEAEQARQVLNDIAGLIEDIPPSVQREVALEIIAGDPESALAIVEAELAASPAPRVAVSADTAPMSEQILEAANDTPTATIEAEADTAAAAEALLDEADRPRIAYIIADALVSIAQGELNTLVNADRTALVDVRTGTISLPSAAELRNRIGAVRVPVQAFWNTRIEGNRPT